jgi:hypothetical protein
VSVTPIAATRKAYAFVGPVIQELAGTLPAVVDTTLAFVALSMSTGTSSDAFEPTSSTMAGIFSTISTLKNPIGNSVRII